MMLKIEFKKNKSADGRIKDIKFLHIHARPFYNSPFEKKYASYTVLPGIAIPLSPLLVSSSLAWRGHSPPFFCSQAKLL
jgi:hypothetical protein